MDAELRRVGVTSVGRDESVAMVCFLLSSRGMNELSLVGVVSRAGRGSDAFGVAAP